MTNPLTNLVVEDNKPRAWMRRWAYEGRECPPKVKNDKGRWMWPIESRTLKITEFQFCDDDVPLYTDEPHLQRIAELEAALRALGWHSPNGEGICWCHVKSDGYAKHSDKCIAANAALTSGK